jgi:Fe-S-cluster-containing dehydrogenase component
MEKHLLTIPNRCTGCNRCVYACAAVKEGMFMPSKARIHINNFPLNGYSVPNICFQCPNADCMKACPQGAIYKNEREVIVVDAAKCDGCGDCVNACPYGMIEQYSSGKAFKCDLCGGNPVCATECHFGALVFKEADKVSLKLRGAQMKQRITEGSPDEKRYQLAMNMLQAAVRVPRTPNYMG